MDVLVEVLELDLSDDVELVLVLDSLFFSVELLDDLSPFPADADFFESDPRLSVR